MDLPKCLNLFGFSKILHRFFIAHDKNVCHLLKLISGHKKTKIRNVKFSHSRHNCKLIFDKKQLQRQL